MRGALVLVLLVGAACGDGNTTDCACTVTIEPETITLGCGDVGCVGGMRFGCDEDNVVPLGRCSSVDAAGGDGGACLPAQAMCDPAASACCAIEPDDGGGVARQPSCDPVTRHCCIPTGGDCSTTADCCSGVVCSQSAARRQCGG